MLFSSVLYNIAIESTDSETRLRVQILTFPFAICMTLDKYLAS